MLLNKKIVAFDLDGTLAESKQVITREMSDLLARLLIKTKVIVVSGGSFSQYQKQFLPFLPEKGMNKSNLILLPTCGSQSYEFNSDLNQWQKIEEVGFLPGVKKQVIKSLEEIIKSNQYDIPTKTWGEIIEDRGTQITFSALGQNAPILEKQKWDPDQIIRQRIKETLVTMISEVDISIGGMTSVDILPKGHNKAKGLERLLKRLDYQPDELVFVGDAIFPGGNDYSVFEAGIETIKVENVKQTAEIIEGWLS